MSDIVNEQQFFPLKWTISEPTTRNCIKMVQCVLGMSHLVEINKRVQGHIYFVRYVSFGG